MSKLIKGHLISKRGSKIKQIFHRALLLMLLFITIAIMFVIAFSFIVESYYVQKIWPDYLSGNHVSIYIWPPEQGKLITDQNFADYLMGQQEELIAYKNFTISGGKAVYIKGNTAFKPTITRGRSFIEEDFLERRPVAIVADGEWTNSNIIMRCGKQYFFHENREYEVVGRFKRESYKNYIEMEYFDALYFVNMSAYFDGVSGNHLEGVYFIDAGENSQDVFKGCKQELKSANASIKAEEIPRSRVNDFLWMIKIAVLRSTNFLVLLLSTAFLVLLNISTITTYWIDGRKKEIGIRLLSGGQISAIKKKILLDYLSVVTLSYALGALFGLIFLFWAGKKFAFGVTFFSWAVIFGYLNSLFIGVVSGFTFLTLRLRKKILLQIRV